MVLFHSYVSLPEGMFFFTHIFSIVLYIKITVFLALPATVTCRIGAFRRRIHLRPHRFRTTTARQLGEHVGKMLEKCWENVGKQVEISINQQVSFNLWPSSTMF